MKLTTDSFILFFRSLNEKISLNKDYLIKLDSIAGDGDLGLSMTDGFNAIISTIDKNEFSDIGALFSAAGKAMAVFAPSSLGTLLSFGFLDVGKVYRERDAIDIGELSPLLATFENAIKRRGGAEPGDKTFLDGFHPAIAALEDASDENYRQRLLAAAMHARHGALRTVGLPAKFGRIAVRGEDSRQILDPGAVVGSMMITVLADTFVNS